MYTVKNAKISEVVNQPLKPMGRPPGYKSKLKSDDARRNGKRIAVKPSLVKQIESAIGDAAVSVGDWLEDLIQEHLSGDAPVGETKQPEPEAQNAVENSPSECVTEKSLESMQADCHESELLDLNQVRGPVSEDLAGLPSQRHLYAPHEYATDADLGITHEMLRDNPRHADYLRLFGISVEEIKRLNGTFEDLETEALALIQKEKEKKEKEAAEAEEEKERDLSEFRRLEGVYGRFNGMTARQVVQELADFFGIYTLTIKNDIRALKSRLISDYKSSVSGVGIRTIARALADLWNKTYIEPKRIERADGEYVTMFANRWLGLGEVPDDINLLQSCLLELIQQRQIDWLKA